MPFPDVAATDLTTTKVEDWYHKRYGQVYGYADTDAPTRMLVTRLQIVGVTPKPQVHLVADVGDAPERPKGTRVIHEHGETLEATVWQRGAVYEGPMVVEQYDTTVYIPAAFRVTVDDHANLIGERV
ncbi:MAG: hypothetical protein GDA49_01945 [Rhodospirillales bacterium]|nr:hypothetical protein [Rhodospirillales bacterium]